jgi:hypothetical protein
MWNEPTWKTVLVVLERRTLVVVSSFPSRTVDIIHSHPLRMRRREGQDNLSLRLSTGLFPTSDKAKRCALLLKELAYKQYLVT